MDLHQAVSQVNSRSKNVPRVLCGSLNVHAFQQLAALRWATEIINNNSWPGEFGIGKLCLQSSHVASSKSSEATKNKIDLVLCFVLL